MRYVKIETFVPDDSVINIISALNDEEIIAEGSYDSVYATSRVTGHWRPLEGANPHIGEVGKLESQPETKIEFRIKAEDLEKTFRIIEREHPYETPVINAFEVMGRSGD